MEVKYRISEKLQKELVAAGKEGKKNQTSVVLDTEVSEIITNSEFVTVTDDGMALLDLTGKVLLHTDYKSIYAKEGPASNWIWRREFTVEKRKFYCGAENDELYWCNHEINSGATIRQALNEIEAINEEKAKTAKERTAEELAEFPGRIAEYNKKDERKKYDEALKKIEVLERQNNHLQKKQEALKEELINEIVDAGYIERIERDEEEVRYSVSAEKD